MLQQYEKCPQKSNFVSIHTGPTSPRIGNVQPDYVIYSDPEATGYLRKPVEAGFFHGCIFHGDLRKNCPLTPENATENTVNFLNASYGTLKRKFDQQKNFLESKNIRVVVQWECDFLKANKLEDFEKTPLNRLIPRDCLRGGRTETFGVFYCKTAQPNKVMQYLDVNRYAQEV